MFLHIKFGTMQFYKKNAITLEEKSAIQQTVIGDTDMANVIAVVWDFDKTLVNGYMQDPIFQKFKVDASRFWQEVNSLPDKYKIEQKVKVNKDTIYLNHILKYVKEEKFKGLNNQMLRDLGKELKYYPGIPEIFAKTKKLIDDIPAYKEYDIKVEHYIVSTGLIEMIKGSRLIEYVKNVWGCELIETESSDGGKILGEIGYTIDNTTKTRAIFEINKGIPQNEEIEVNAKMPEELRRVHFQNMIYIADGPSDIPAFSVVNQFGGATFAIYPAKDDKAFKQVEDMRKAGRINMYAEANYSEGTTAYMWITHKIKEFAERIYNVEKARLTAATGTVPKHLV